MLPGIFLAFATLVQASPPPVLPWVTSQFSVELNSGRVEFRMECPGGRLTRLSAIRGQQVAEFPVDRLAGIPISPSCSGVSTRAALEEEGSANVIGVELTVQLSHEYVNEELWVFFDLRSFRFAQARWMQWIPGKPAQIERVQL